MKKYIGITLFALVLPTTLIALSLIHYQTLSDYIKLRGYEPPARIREIRDDLRLTSKGETLFYVHDPQIVGSDSFSSLCPVAERTIVLGCYYTNTSIYIYDVDDLRDELQGVEEVTAAHEMLHAAYDRLNQDEKARIISLLEAEYTKLRDDSKIKENIDEYGPQGDLVVQNELHSIIGTEVADINPELEMYYAQYFEDRSAVVAIADGYSEVFRSLERQIEDYDRQLSSISEEIVSTESLIADYQQELQSRSDELDSLRDQPSEFNRRVDSYNRLVSEYNATIREYEALINNYNELVNERNEISAEQRTLYDAIDARVKDLEV